MAEREPAEVVLVAHDLAGGGGMETVLRRQLPALASRWRLTVVSCSMDDDLAELVTWERVRVPGFPVWLKTLCFWLVAGARLRRLAARRAPGQAAPLLWTTGAIVPQRTDLVSVHFCHAGYVDQVGWAAGMRGARRLNARWSRWLSLQLERWSYRPGRAGRLLAVSGGLAEEVARHYPGLPVVVTPLGVDLPHRVARPERDGHLRVLFVGGDWARKGLGIALEAVAAVDGVRLDVVGDGPDALGPAAARALGVADRVVFHPWTSEVSRHYENHDVLVLPSRYETFGLVVFEAAAHGLVPLTTAVHGVTDLVEDGCSGYLVPLASDVVADALVRLRDDPELVARLGTAARTRAARFTWDSSIDCLTKEVALSLCRRPPGTT